MKKILTIVFAVLAVMLASCKTQNVCDSYFVNHHFGNKVHFTDVPDQYAYIVEFEKVFGLDTMKCFELRFSESKFFSEVDSISRDGKIIYSKVNGDKMITTLNNPVEIISIDEMKKREYVR